MARQWEAPGANQRIGPANLFLRTSTSYSIIFWFLSPDNSGGNDFANLYNEANGFPVACSFLMGQSGAITWKDRDSDASSADLVSAIEFDDGVWHWLFGVKRNNTDREMFIDGNSEDTDTTTTVDTDGVPIESNIGAGSPNYLPAGGRIARVVRLPGVALTLKQAREVAFFGPERWSNVPNATWYELTGENPEPELFGDGRLFGDVTNTIMGAHPPIRFRDPRIAERVIPFVPPAPSGRIMSSLAYRGGLAGKGGIAGIGGGLAG